MKTHRERGRAKYRLSVKLDTEWDADLIAWLESLSPGSRSALIRTTLRAGLREPAHWEPVDIGELRRVMAEELSRALVGYQMGVSTTSRPEPETGHLEAKYGAKLDRMLRGLSRDPPS